MTSEKLAVLKAKQDTFDAQKEKLLEKFVPFRSGVVQELELFIEDALSSGLRNVRRLRRVRDTRESIEIEFSLNSMDLVMISSNEAYFQNVMMEDLAAKIFIYESGDENHTPLLELAFIESSNDQYRIQMQWFAQGGAKPLSDIKLSEESAGKAASAIVNLLYRFQFSWKEKPTRKAISGKDSKSSFGFVKE